MMVLVMVSFNQWYEENYEDNDIWYERVVRLLGRMFYLGQECCSEISISTTIEYIGNLIMMYLMCYENVSLCFSNQLAFFYKFLLEFHQIWCNQPYQITHLFYYCELFLYKAWILDLVMINFSLTSTYTITFYFNTPPDLNILYLV